MRSGKIISEWDCHWGDLPKGKQEARLVCPNGQVPIVKLSSGDIIDDRVFVYHISDAIAGIGRTTWADVIGIVYGTDGQCIFYSWERLHNRLVGPSEDTFPNMQYGGPVTHTLDAYLLGVKA